LILRKDAMANRRMFSKDIISSDSFLSMSATAQNLYFHLGMEADDDGFVPFTKVSKMLGTSHDDMAQLLGRGFLLQFPYGVFVIRDWLINNQIRKDRYTPTIYQKELSKLRTNTSNQYYIENNNSLFDNDNNNDDWQPHGNHLATQDSIGKVRLGKVREREEDQNDFDLHTPQKRKYSRRTEITEDVLKEIATNYQVPYRFVENCWDSAINWLDAKGKRQKNYKAFLSNWVKREKADYILKSKKLTNSRGGVYVIEE